MAELISLAKARGDSFRSNIIFIHGLTGDPLDTWTSPFEDEPIWPKWLAADIDGCAVWSVGYDAPVSERGGATMHPTDIANGVFNRLLAKDDLTQGDLILIGHSLGGLIIKLIMRRAANDTRMEAKRFFERVRKIAFLATPHSGADLAAWGELLRLFVRPSPAAVSLVRNDPNLRELNENYRDIAGKRKLQHLILTERRPLIMKGVNLGVIVKPDSGDPGLSTNPIPIDADHVSIAKPANKDSEIYDYVRSFVRREVGPYLSPEEMKLEAVKSDTGFIRADMSEVLTLLRQSGALQRAEQEGISEDAVRKIVLRLDGDVREKDDLIPFIDNWITAAQRKLARHTNEDEAFEAARREAERRFKAGMENASSALMDEYEREELVENNRQEERKRRRLRMLNEAMHLDALSFDAAGVLQKVQEMAKVEGVVDTDAMLDYFTDKASHFLEDREEEYGYIKYFIADSIYSAAHDKLSKNPTVLNFERLRALIAQQSYCSQKISSVFEVWNEEALKAIRSIRPKEEEEEEVGEIESFVARNEQAEEITLGVVSSSAHLNPIDFDSLNQILQEECNRVGVDKGDVCDRVTSAEQVFDVVRKLINPSNTDLKAAIDRAAEIIREKEGK